VTDCENLDAIIVFWQEALHNRPAEGGWVVLANPQRRGLNISLNRVQRRSTGRNRLHIDLYTEDRNGEARQHRSHRQRYCLEYDLRVLEDSYGNLFCVVKLEKKQGLIRQPGGQLE
jgi:hypothetical protein